MSFFRKKWKLHLYLNGIYVGCKRIEPTENPQENVYVVHFWFKRQIFKSNHVKCVIHPTKLLHTDVKRRTSHYTFEYEEGVNVWMEK